MELEEFIKTTLISIANGLKGANVALIGGQDPNDKHKTFFISRSTGDDEEHNQIEFDVAVTTSEVTKSGKDGKINIVKVFQGGMGKEAEASNSVVSRVKFRLSTHRIVG